MKFYEGAIQRVAVEIIAKISNFVKIYFFIFMKHNNIHTRVTQHECFCHFQMYHVIFLL